MAGPDGGDSRPSSGLPPVCRFRREPGGYTLVEMLVVVSVLGLLATALVPPVLRAVEGLRGQAAARYLVSRLSQARLAAVGRSAAVAIRFEVDGPEVTLAAYIDGNGNGIRTRDIELQIDRPIEPAVRLAELFPGVAFALELEGEAGEAIQFGAGRLVTFTPAGTASSGSVYLRAGDGTQYAIRVLGTTGRTRLLRYHRRAWTEVL